MYLAAADPAASSRTWQEVFAAIVATKTGSTRERWVGAVNQAPFDRIRQRTLANTRAEHFLQVIQSGTVATNVFLRRAHNFAVDMGWLVSPILLKRQWPPVQFKPRRAITRQEHDRIIAAEKNPQLNAFYRLCWHLGGSQSDMAMLTAEDVNWTQRTITYQRGKTGTPVIIHFGPSVDAILKSLPLKGPLLPRLLQLHEKHRAKQFHRRCRLLGIAGVSLHSYRYAWAERARQAGMPERFAQEALGHNSTAVHRAYAKHANVQVPSLEAYEEQNVANRTAQHPSTCPTFPLGTP